LKNYYTEDRKLCPLDFNIVCVLKLNLDTLSYIIKNKYIIGYEGRDPKTDNEYYNNMLINKIEHQQKIYLFDVNNIEEWNNKIKERGLGPESRSFRAPEQLSCDNQINIDILEEFDKYKKYINLNSFTNYVDIRIKTIKDELELICMLFILNMLYLEYEDDNIMYKIIYYYINIMLGINNSFSNLINPNNNSDNRYIKEEIKKINININNKYNDDTKFPIKEIFNFKKIDLNTMIKPLNDYQKCLLLQTISGNISNNVLYFSHNFKNIGTYIINNIKIDCISFIDKNKVKCYHKTYSYYSYNKWIMLFNYILYNYNINFKLKPDDFYNLDIQVINPRFSFCDRCYNHYKSYDSLKENINTSSNSKYITLINKNKLKLFRASFADNCDIPEKVIHFGEYLNVNNSIGNIHSIIIKSIQNEIETYTKELINPKNKNEENFNN
jgi:hypothetical protein